MLSARECANQLGTVLSTATLLGSSSQRATVWERGGVTASIVPSAPGLPMANMIGFTSPQRMLDRLDDVLRAYKKRGVHVCRLWVPDWLGSEVRPSLTKRGFAVGDVFLGMTLDLTQFEANPPGKVWIDAGDAATLAKVNEDANGDAARGLPAALADIPDDFPVRIYRAGIRPGQTAAALCTIDRGEDCGVLFVATVPEERNQGIATALVNQVMAEAQTRGCSTSSLQASLAGVPMYTKLGWEARAMFLGLDRRI